MVTIRAVIKQADGRYARRGLHITEAIASDDTGSVRLVWFNQPYRAQQFNLTGHSTIIADRPRKHYEYYVSGEFKLSYQRLCIINPSVELVSSLPINTARIIPIYREVAGDCGET